MNMVLRKVKEIKRNDSVREHDLVVVKGGNAKSITI
jgi:small nuclear ribonucleoprotein (snRNP)-like protein